MSNNGLRSKFLADGYVVLDDFLTDDEVAELRKAGDELINNIPKDERKAVFSTTKTEQSKDRYFLESADRVSYFFEASALDEDGELQVPAEVSLNKVGHALHSLHPTFRQFTFCEKVKEACFRLGFEDPVVVQSMYIFKNPGTGSEVSPHQDASFLHTEPVYLAGFWIALEDATPENGCLWVAPGSHRSGVHRRFVRSADPAAPELLVFTAPLPFYPTSNFRPLPVRRGSQLFPMKYCAIRWVENFSVAARALQILPYVEKYVEGVKKDRKTPSCNSFKIVSKGIQDKLLKAKLCFFHLLAADLEPFLTKFQSDFPLAPLLYEAILATMKCVLSRFVISDVIERAKSIASVEFEKKENLIFAKNIDLGYSTTAALRNTHGVNEKEVLEFRLDCRNAMVVFCKLLVERSPIKFMLTKGISCFDPEVARIPAIRDKRLTLALKTFVSNNWISGTEADKVQREFREVCASNTFLDVAKTFSPHNERLDSFWLCSLLPTRSSMSEALTSFLKMIFILFHGNAALERGFSVNKEILVENLHEELLIAQRLVYDAVLVHEGLKNVTVCKQLIQYARNAHGVYVEALKKRHESQEAEEATQSEKKKRKLKLKELSEKKRKLLEEAQQAVAAVEEEMLSL